MDNETKEILMILGVAIAVLYIAKPKKHKRKVEDLASNVEPPKTTKDKSDVEFENAVISIKAYRSAINNEESESNLESLNRITLKDYGIKVFKTKSGKLVARNTKGEDIALEEDK